MTLNLLLAFPVPLTLADCRKAMGIGPTLAAKCLGLQYPPYFKKETGVVGVSVGEINLFMILAHLHPHWRLTTPYDPVLLPDLLTHTQPTGDEIKALRIKLAQTQAAMAEQLGYKVSSWKMKENLLKPASLKTAEYNLLLMLCNEHPSLGITAA